MSTIDERVVAFKLNNSQFMSAAKQTLTTMSSLVKGTDFSKSASSIDKMSTSISDIPLAKMNTGFQDITASISAMGVIGITTIQNLTNQVVNFSTNLAKALTIDPVKTGLSEYETKINAIQTILTNTESKGTTLDQVTAALDELNEYADLTIYNFAQMTKNIGTFTAAGVGLEESTAAIKGMANLAAGTGSTAMQLNTAMYQMSQALSAGSLKLIDYNSLVNAGMGGELFKNAAIEMAILEGAISEGQITAETFRESLSSGWLTSDILLKTFEGFSEDQGLVDAATQVKTFTQLLDTMKESVQSGWAKTWELLIGDINEAKQLLTGISNAFNDIAGRVADIRNEWLEAFIGFEGRDAAIESIALAFNTVKMVVDAAIASFRNFIPAIQPEQIAKIFIGIRNFLREIYATVENNGPALQQLTTIFNALFGALGLGLKIITPFVQMVLMLGKALLTIGASALKPVLSILADLSTSLSGILNGISFDSTNLMNGFANLMEQFTVFGVNAVEGFIYGIWEGIKQLPNAIRNFANVAITTFKELLDINSPSGVFMEFGGNIVDGLIIGITNTYNKLKPIITKWASDIYTWFMDGGLLKIPRVIGDYLASVFDFEPIVTNVHNAIEHAKKKLTDLFYHTDGTLKSFNDLWKQSTKAVSDWFANISSKFDGVKDFLSPLKKIFTDPFNAIIALFTNFINKANEFIQAIKQALFYDENGEFSEDKLITNTIVTGLISSMALIANAFNSIASIAKSVTGVADEISRTLGSVRGALEAWQESLKPTLLEQITKVIISLVASLLVLSLLDGQRIQDAMSTIVTMMITMTTIIIILMGAIKLLTASSSGLTKGKVNINVGIAGVLFSIGIILVAIVAAIGMIASMSPEQIKTGLFGLVAIIVAITALLSVLFISIKTLNKDVASATASFAVMEGISSVISKLAFVILAIAGAMWIMRNMEASAIVSASIVIGVVLAAIAGIIFALQKIDIMAVVTIEAAAKVISALSFAILAIAGAVYIIGRIPIESSINAFIGLGLMIAAITAAVWAMSKMPAIKPTVLISLVALAGTILVVSYALQNLAEISGSQMTTAILGLAGAVVVLGGSAALLSLLGPAIIIGAASLLALGAAAWLTSVALLNFIEVINQISEDGFDEKIVDALDNMWDAFIMFIESLPEKISQLFDTLEQMRDDIIGVIIDLANKIFSWFTTIGTTIGNIAKAWGERVWTAVKDIPELIWQALSTGVPAILDKLISVGSDIVNGIISGMKKAITNIGDTISDIGSSVVDGFKDFFGINSPAKETMFVGEGIVEGIAVGMDDTTGVLDASIEDLGINAQDSLTDNLSNLDVSSAGESIIDTFKKPLEDFSLDSINLDSITNMFTPTSDSTEGSWFDTLLGGIFGKNKQDEMVDNGESLTDSLLEGVDQDGLDDDMEDVAHSATDSFTDGLNDNSGEVATAGNNLADDFNDALSDGLEAGGRDAQEAVSTTIDEAIDGGVDSMKNAHYEFYLQGYQLMQEFAKGIKESVNSVAGPVQAMEDVLRDILDVAGDLSLEMWQNAGRPSVSGLGDADMYPFYDLGQNMIEGIIDGLESKEGSLYSVARSIINDAISAMNDAAETASPSKLTTQTGTWLGEGLINGLSSTSDDMITTARKQMQDVIKTIDESLDADMDLNPVITPVLDLDDINKGISTLDSSMQSKQLNLGLQAKTLSSSFTPDSQNGSKVENNTIENNYTFNQTNNSPKSLSAKEIFRQTRSQFASFKRRTQEA